MNAEEIFHAALTKPTAERAGFLDLACRGNAQLRAAVELLLAAQEASSSSVKPPRESMSGGTAATAMDSPSPAVDEAATHEQAAHASAGENSDSARLATTYCSRDAVAGVVIAGRYTVQDKIGEGGMGEVWVARQTEPVKRKVALKLIKVGMDSKAVLQRFEQERQALALMDHPNIARVLGRKRETCQA